MTHAMVPIHAGVLSALGMLVAPQGRQRSQGINRRLEDVAPGEIRQVFARLENAAHGQLREEGVAVAEVDYRLDLRYFGQSATLSLPWSKDMKIADAFHAHHRRQFGYALDMPIELVTLRVGLYAKAIPLALPPLAARLPAAPIRYTPVHGFAKPVAVYQREALAPEQVLSGLCLIAEGLATTWINPGWRCRIHPTGSLLLDQP